MDRKEGDELIALERAVAKGHARSPRFKRVVDEANRYIEEALQRMEQPSVAFSGGKDSTVVLDLVRRQRSDVVAHFGHEQWLLPETEAFVAQVGNLVKTALPDSHAEWFSVWQNPDDVPDDTQYINREEYTEFNYERRMMGWDGKFLGLRAEENSYRRIFLKRFGAMRYCSTHDMWECNPIAFWKVEDVWAYIVSRDLPYNKAYDKLAELGVPIINRRIGPLAQQKVLEHGQMVILRRGWPDLFGRFAAAHPEAWGYV